MSKVTLGKVAILKRETFYVDGVEVAWIPGYEERYAISKDGQVYQAPKVIYRKTRWGEEIYPFNIQGQWISKSRDKHGYDRVLLNGKEKQVHRLLGLTWIYNPDPKHRTEVDHENRDKTDNRLCNLRWLTHRENRLNQQNRSGLEAGQGKDPNAVKAANKRANDKRKNDPEHREKERERNAERRAEPAATETHEERRARLDANNAKAKAKRANETPQEKEERLAKRRAQDKARRERKKAEAGE